MSRTRSTTPEVFVSYSHRDERRKDVILAALAPIGNGAQITFWNDRMIEPGTVWYESIHMAMDRATLAVCLLSQDFLFSDFCVRDELARLVVRQQRDGLRIIPVLIEPCTWQSLPWLESLQLLPVGAMSIAELSETAQREALIGVRAAVEEMLGDAAYRPRIAARRTRRTVAVNFDAFPRSQHTVFGRATDLQSLTAAWRGHGSHVYVLYGRGGVGKTALVWEWLDHMRALHYRGAERVFGYSFHRADDEGTAAADPFLSSALAWFGDTEARSGSPWDKAERLADHMRRSRTLLVLDSVDALQERSGIFSGQVRDPGLSTLLTELAMENPGLCIVTTRQPIRDLDLWGDNAPQASLEQLSNEAGRLILQASGVAGPDAELERASHVLSGDALALKLLAGHVQRARERSVADVLATSEANEQPDTRPAERLLSAVLRDREDSAELDVLNMLALFDRPAEPSELDVLRAAPAIPGLTDHVCSLSEREWRRVLRRLQESHLVAVDDSTEAVDVHAVIRAFFARRLADAFPDAWREGHRRLGDHLEQTAEPLPATLDAMAPLFAAIRHQCHAGRVSHAVTEVFRNRIQRDREDYALVQLGAAGDSLAALAHAFARPFDELRPLDVEEAAYVYAMVGGCLRRRGDFTAALAVQTRRLEMDLLSAESCSPLMTFGGVPRRASVQRAIFMRAAVQDASNMSELHLLLGSLPEAAGAAEEARKKLDEAAREAWDVLPDAERSTFNFWYGVLLTTIGEVFRCMGQTDEAQSLFDRLERKSGELSGLRGFRLCSLLCDLHRYPEVIKRASRTLQRTDNWPADRARDHLSLGRAYLALHEIEEAREHIELAVTGAREVAEADLIGEGFCTRAELRLTQGLTDPARADVNRALALSLQTGARLIEGDAYVLLARIEMAEGNVERARRSVRRVRQIVEQTHYRRLDTLIGTFQQTV